ncbi:MAG: ATP-grasp domain-containing protein, partial [Archaeoglobaceae archaeon]
DDFTLLRLTRIAEKYCENLGSSSKAIEVTSDKWKLYKKLKGKIPMPKTSKKELDVKFIVKPRVSCGGEGIKFSNTVPENYIAQEYIEGKNLSASVIVGEEIRVVSINEQILENFRYKGAIVPARVEEGEALEICEVAINAVESIKGLKGYVGVDLVYSDQPYVVEVNARITTPVVAFERAYGISVADMLMGQKSFTFRRQIVEKGKFNDFFAKVGDFSLRIRDFR